MFCERISAARRRIAERSLDDVQAHRFCDATESSSACDSSLDVGG